MEGKESRDEAGIKRREVEARTDERERTEWNFAFNQESNETGWPLSLARSRRRAVGIRRSGKSGEDKAWKALNGI